MCTSNSCKKCSKSCCHSIDAKASFDYLLNKYNDLASILMAIIEENNQVNLELRNTAESQLKEKLIKIIGGKEVPEGGYPECCLIGTIDSQGSIKWFCSGILVKRGIVLTAAHCNNENQNYIVALNTINSQLTTNAELIIAKETYPHPDYKKNNYGFDLCAIVLSKNSTVQPIEIASSEEIGNATSNTLVGFGHNNLSGTAGFGKKREVDVAIKSIQRSPEQDLSIDEHKYGFNSNLEFVAGGNGYDSCKGDSGGPAYINVEGTRKLAGITARAAKDKRVNCGDGGIYTRIDKYIDFINNI